MTAPTSFAPLSFDRARFDRALRTASYGRSLDLRAETDSTNDDARAAAQAGVAAGHVIVAESQRRGRGSQGRGWSSPRGGLYFSLVERFAASPASLPPLTLAVGLAVAEAIEVFAPKERAAIKWPNDVFVQRRKCAGVLVESALLGARISHVVIGVGLNVARDAFPPELADTAIALSQITGAPPAREEVLAAVLGTLEARIATFRAEGVGPLRPAIEARLLYRGERVRVQGERGTLLGLADDGALRIDQGHRVYEARSGSLEPDSKSEPI